MAMHRAGLGLQSHHYTKPPEAESLAALPRGTVVAVFAGRGDANSAAVQLLTDDPAVCLWLRTGREASAAIRAARSRRSLAIRALRGFGNEELQVREILRRSDGGSSVLVIREGPARSLRALNLASHVYRFGAWTVQPLLELRGHFP